MKRGRPLERRTPLVTRAPLAPGLPLHRKSELKPKSRCRCGALLPLLLPSDTDDPKRICTCGSSDREWGFRWSTLQAKGSGLGAATGLPKPSTDFPPAVRSLVRLRSGGGCELAGCGQAATDHHHRRRRELGPQTAVNDARLCHEDHMRAHGSPDWARSVGLIVLTTEDPAEVPILTDSGWVLLAEDGSYERTSAPSEAGVA